jgi:hypothetical protein
MSDSQIAEHVGVDDKTVAKYRAELVAASELPKIETRTVKRGDQEYEIDTSNIGKKSAVEAEGDGEPEVTQGKPTTKKRKSGADAILFSDPGLEQNRTERPESDRPTGGFVFGYGR